MADTKISASAGETGGIAETADLTGTFLRKDGLYVTPFQGIPAVVPGTPVAQVSSFSGTGGNATTAGGGLHETLNAQGLYTLQGGVVPGSVITAAGTVANTSAITQLVGLTIPAADVTAGAVYLIKASGVYSDTGTPTIAFGLVYGGAGGTSIATLTSAALGSGVSNLSFAVEAQIQFWTTTTATGYATVDIGGTAPTVTRNAAASGNASVAVTTGTSKVLSLCVTWSAASASNTISAMTAYGMRLA